MPTDTELSPAALADMLVEQLGYDRALAVAEDVASLIRLMRVDDTTEEAPE